MSAASFRTLVTAVKAAGLVVPSLDGEMPRTLKRPGPFTVCAPTDEAFAKVPKDRTW